MHCGKALAPITSSICAGNLGIGYLDEVVPAEFLGPVSRSHNLAWNLSQHQTFFPPISSAVAPAQRALRR
jgi:hypothetical protein